ncbi:MAG: L,D-transpeptidase [Candidatus Protochlamydia sp.]|nr:L,D-transpeptidase [Candidatus Protochlamydia sp.]
MTLPKLLAYVSIILFGAIGIAAIFKSKPAPESIALSNEGPWEVELDNEIQSVVPAFAAPSAEKPLSRATFMAELPEADRIEELFNKNEPKAGEFVETVVYKSHVAWLKGRPAWLSDYASHYETSRHFIARSLNGKADYFKQDVSEGDRFNVLRKDKNIEFYLVVDTSRCKMWFYCLAEKEKKPFLIKTYPVGLGCLDSSSPSGLLTPLGKYTLGDRIAIYRPKSMGIYQGKKIEMVTVFGTRWIPFDQEIGLVTAPAKGLGLHGTPWERTSSGDLISSQSGIGKYESDGCIRLNTPDLEELFSIIITKPTTIEIVSDFENSSLPGIQ